MENWVCSKGAKCKSRSVLSAENFRKRPTGPLAYEYWRTCNNCRRKPLRPLVNSSALRRCGFCRTDRELDDFVDANGNELEDLANGQVERRQIVDFVKSKWDVCKAWGP